MFFPKKQGTIQNGRGKPLPYGLVGSNYSTGAPQYSQQPFSSGVVVAPQ